MTRLARIYDDSTILELLSLLYKWVVGPIVDNIVKRPNFRIDVDLDNRTRSKSSSSYSVLRGVIEGKLTLQAIPIVGEDAIIYVNVKNHGKVAALIDEIGLQVFYTKTRNSDRQTYGILSKLVLHRIRILAHRELMYMFFESEYSKSFKVKSTRRNLRIRDAESIRVNICNIALLTMFLKVENAKELVLRPYLKISDGRVIKLRHNSIMRVTETNEICSRCAPDEIPP